MGIQPHGFTIGRIVLLTNFPEIHAVRCSQRNDSYFASNDPRSTLRSDDAVAAVHTMGKANAVCPVCGAFVGFYANEFGSRVYFDEIGPPWPKHPCTDNAAHSAGASRDAGRTMPTLYSLAVGHRKLAESSSLADTKLKAFIVLQEVRQNNSATLIHLQQLYTKSKVGVWETPANVSLEVGQLVFLDGAWLSYVDTEMAQVFRVAVRFLHRIAKDSLLQRLRARWDS
ncbi:hypothetical protein AHiyo6_08790 [Arthrobacter sp. Hiyo6]|nr:hypothetical protein AHiyo6_08790 [Arthrobacter sp. Hiyo6]